MWKIFDDSWCLDEKNDHNLALNVGIELPAYTVAYHTYSHNTYRKPVLQQKCNEDYIINATVDTRHS